MLPPLTHTADARTAGWRKVPRRILPRTSSVWRQPRRPRSRPPIPQRRMNVEASGGTRFHPRPTFFMPRAWLLFCAERHVTGYPVRPLREWIRARVEPRPPGFLARRSTRSVLDCGREAERSHRFGRGARTGEAQRRSPACPAGESGGKPPHSKTLRGSRPRKHYGLRAPLPFRLADIEGIDAREARREDAVLGGNLSGKPDVQARRPPRQRPVRSCGPLEET